MSKKEALHLFKTQILPGIKAQYEKDGFIDHPARCEAWNDFTDALCKSKRITPKQYDRWSNPF